ncbi:DUF1194 domain-containing protein [Algicella marina]|nr:DUF1194 domain-containing protein [Algicella marina]
MRVDLMRGGILGTLGLSLVVGTQQVQACDLALVLAVDVSASISPTEYDLQMRGLADALLDPEISEALQANQAALTLVQWSGSSRQVVSIDWRRVLSEADMAGFSEMVNNTDRAWQIYSTAVGEALLFSDALFAEVPDCLRRVIDVSGDGLSNEGLKAHKARDEVVSRGTTINGLAIETSISGLTRYFEDAVTGGPGAFVETAETYASYPEAIRRKLLREVIKPAF